MWTCEEVRRYFEEEWGRSLDAAARRALAEHLASCPRHPASWRLELEALEVLWEGAPAPRHLRERVLRRLRRRVRWAAAGLAIAGLVVAVLIVGEWRPRAQGPQWEQALLGAPERPPEGVDLWLLWEPS